MIEWFSSSQRKRHQNSNNSLFFDRTQNKAHIVCSRRQKNWTYIQSSFSNSTNRESHYSDFSNYMCFWSFSNESRYKRSIADIRIRFKRNQITFENSQTFVFYVIANVCVLKHVVNVVDRFSISRHRKKKRKKKKKNKKKKKKKRKILIFRKSDKSRKDDEKRDLSDRRKLKKEEKRREELKEKEKKNMMKVNKKNKKMIWKLNKIKSTKERWSFWWSSMW